MPSMTGTSSGEHPAGKLDPFPTAAAKPAVDANALLKACSKRVLRLFGRIPEDNAFECQRKLLGPLPDPVIFDGGAFVGDTALQYKALFPDSHLTCFEPFPDSFQKLQARTSHLSRVTLVNAALADTAGHARLNINTDLSSNSLFGRPRDAKAYYDPASVNVKQEEVELITLDAYCAARKIARVDILKLDTEGAELKVLKGGESLLKQRAIGMVYAEVMFIPHYEGGVLFYELCAYLASWGYSLFNVYELKRAPDGQLRWGNAIFLNSDLRARLAAPCVNHATA